MVNYLFTENCDSLSRWSYGRLNLTLTTERQEGLYAINCNNTYGEAKPTVFNGNTWPEGRKVWGFWLKIRGAPATNKRIDFILSDYGVMDYVLWTIYPKADLSTWRISAEAGNEHASAYDGDFPTGWHWLEVDWQDKDHISFYIDGDRFCDMTNLGVILGKNLTMTVVVYEGRTCPDTVWDYIVAADDLKYPPEYPKPPEAPPPPPTGGGGEAVAIQVWRGSSLIYNEPEEDRNLVKMTVERNLNHEDTADIRLDNEPPLDIQVGDVLKIWISSGSTILTKVFNGEITEVRKEREEGEAFLDISAAGWGKVLKEHEITKSFPTATNVADIVKAIVSDVTDPDPEDWEHLITVNNVESTTKTRTIDFEGVTMLEALQKLSQCTGCDFYVDPNKNLHWFPRFSRISGETLTVEHLQDYEHDEKREICNWAKVFGAPVRTCPDPWDVHIWTETLHGWTLEAYIHDGSVLPSTFWLISSEEWVKDGTHAIQFWILDPVSGTAEWEAMKLSLTLDYPLDLSLKESFKSLKFALAIWAHPTSSGDNLRRKRFDLYLYDVSNRKVVFPAGDKNISWYQGDLYKPGGYNQPAYQEFSILVGPEEVEEGKWELLDSTFDWSLVKKIEWIFELYPLSGDTIRPFYGFIDWVHFDEGRWTGEWKLADTDPLVIKYGRAYAEFYDESAYTPEDCGIQAKYLVGLYKEPIPSLNNVEIDYNGMETIDPGEIVKFEIPEGTFSMGTQKITWIWEGDLYGKLVVEYRGVPPGEGGLNLIQNGGFEQDCEYWEYSPDCPVTTQYKHSGNKSCFLYENWIQQTLSGSIAVSEIETFGFYYYEGRTDNYCEVFFTDDTSCTIWLTANGSVWSYMDLSSTLPVEKYVSAIKFRGATTNPSWIDDVELIRKM